MEAALFSLIKIALQVDPDRSASVTKEFKTILSALCKETPQEAPQATPKEAPKEASKEAPKESLNDFMQRNITEQFMSRSPSLVIHPIPHEQPRYIPGRFSFNHDHDYDTHSIGSIESIKGMGEVYVVKAPSVPPISKIDDENDILNTAFCMDIPPNMGEDAEEVEEVEDAEEVEEVEEAEEAEEAFEEFPLKDGMHYKDPTTNIVYKEKEGITRVGVFNTDTNKFKRDAK